MGKNKKGTQKVTDPTKEEGQGKEAKGEPAKPSAARQQRRQPGRKRRCCPEWLPWVLFPVMLFGVLPMVVLHLPLYVPPLPEMSSFTMVGGPGIQGVRGLWSMVNTNQSNFCLEIAAPDTLRCMVLVWELTWEIMRAPSSVDFYVAHPLRTWEAANKTLRDMTSPLRVGRRWEEGAICRGGVTRSQIAKKVLDGYDLSDSRLPPMGSSYGAFSPSGDFGCMDEMVAKIDCQKEFAKVFGSEREAVLGSDITGGCENRRLTPEKKKRMDTLLREKVWSGKPKVLYTFGIATAIETLAAIPSDVPEDMPINVVLVPADDRGYRWYVNTRGREVCDKEKFQAFYENFWHYFSWVVRPYVNARSPSRVADG